MPTFSKTHAASTWMLHGASAVGVVASALLLTGCGGSDSASTTTGPSTTAQDAQTASASSAVAGTATDAGLNQLYVGGSIALLEPPRTGVVSDGGSGITEIMRSASVVRPEPLTGAGMITTTLYTNPVMISGSIAYSSDTVGLPANWYHISLTFSASAPFTIRTDEGNTAAITGGELDMYVHNVDGTDDGAGTWTRTVDSYESIPAGSPLTVTVTLGNGTVRTSSLTGLRHVVRGITHALNGSTVTRTDNVQVDGNVSGVPITPSLTNGPSLPDRTGTSQVFTDWQSAVQINTGGQITDHTFVWNRYCTYTVTYTYQLGTIVWSGAISDYVENVYVTLDGVQVGPLSDLQIDIDYLLLHNMNGSGAEY
jgi:hypothetical protein